MTKQEYDSKKKLIEKEMEKSLENLYCLYALSNSKYKKGDIIQDKFSNVRIKIEKINVSFFWNKEYPECIYSGYRLKKDNSFYKKKEWHKIWQARIGEVK